MGHPLPTTKCGKCDRRIVWRESAKTGAAIPLDARRGQVYLAVPGVATCVQLDDAYVTHFATCPHASEFSKSRKPTDDVALAKVYFEEAKAAIARLEGIVTALEQSQSETAPSCS